MSPAHRRHDSVLISLLLVAGTFLLYLVLAQDAGYGDGPGAILEIRAGAAFQDPIHYLYMPMIVGMSRLLGWAGLSLSLFQVGYITSALGTAVGVGLLYAATRRLASKHDPLLVAALTACCPAVVFFATVMEYHGPYFAFASLATYAMVRLVQAPRWSQAVLVGLATGLAYLAHASAHLLPWFLLLCFFALAERSPAHGSWRHHLLLAAVVVVAHVAFVFLATFALQTLLGASVSSGSALDWIEAEASRPYERLQLLPLTFWYEVLWPYLLLSVTWLWGFRSRTHRPLALALLLALLTHLGMCMVLVPGYNEHGAYQMPLAWLLALITVRSLPRPVVITTLACTALLAVVQVQLHDDPEPARNYSRSVRELANGEPLCLIIGKDFVDYEACALYLTEPATSIEAFDIAKIAVRSPDAVRAALQDLDRDLHARLDRGQQVILSDGAYQTLASPIAQSLGGAGVLKEHLETHYRLQKVSAAGFAGWRVQRNR